MSQDTTQTKRRLFRTKGRGPLKAVALYIGLPVWLVRLGFIIGTIMTGFWIGVLAYIALLFIIPSQPQEDIAQEVAGVNRRYKSIEKRLQNLETVVTSKEFSWESRLYR